MMGDPRRLRRTVIAMAAEASAPRSSAIGMADEPGPHRRNVTGMRGDPCGRVPETIERVRDARGLASKAIPMESATQAMAPADDGFALLG